MTEQIDIRAVALSVAQRAAEMAQCAAVTAFGIARTAESLHRLADIEDRLDESAGISAFTLDPAEVKILARIAEEYLDQRPFDGRVHELLSRAVLAVKR